MIWFTKKLFFKIWMYNLITDIPVRLFIFEK